MTASAEAAGSSSAAFDGAALLERAVGYTRGCLSLVAGTAANAPTPCARWDLRALLTHMDDSLAALTDAAAIGYVDLVPVPAGDPGPLVDRLRVRACALLAAWSQPGPGDVTVADRVLPADLLAAGLARDLLDLLPRLVDDADRPHRFADPVDVPMDADAPTRLLAALGRAPRPFTR